MSQKEELPYQFRKVPRVNKKGVTLIVTTSPIPTHPSTHLVDTALESVLKMNYPFAEVIVSYDMPPKGEKASYREYKKIMKKKYPQFTHLPMKKHGHFIGSFYNALAHTQTEHFFMLQHDIKLAKEFPIEKCLKYTFDWNIIATHHLKDGLKETHWFPIFEQKNKDLWKVWGWSERIFLSKRDWMMDKIYHYYTSGDTRNFIEKVFHNKFKELWQKQSGLKGYREFARHKITRDEMKEYNKFWNEWKCFALKSNVAYHVHLFGRTAKTKKKKRTLKRGGASKGKTKQNVQKQSDLKQIIKSMSDAKILKLMKGRSFDTDTKHILYQAKTWPEKYFTKDELLKYSKRDTKKTIKQGRKGPDESATKYPVGTEKLGNDGNTWVINVSKKGVQRWVKQATKSARDENKSARGKNKPLEKLWTDMSNMGTLVFILKKGKHKIQQVHFFPEGGEAYEEKIEEGNNDPNVKAILTAGNSFDGYQQLYDRVKQSSVDQVLKDYKKYWKYKMDGKLLTC